MKTVLTIAGSDCSGGAGIQADIKTITVHKMYAMSAITSLTAQNTTGVYDIFDASPAFVAQELDCIFSDIRPDAVKIGMVSQPAIIEVISQKLREYAAENIVVDPVMIATSGSRLLAPEAMDALQRLLLPLASVITPNLPEAEALSGLPIHTTTDMVRAAQEIAKHMLGAILIKGGHLAETVQKTLVPDHRIVVVERRDDAERERDGGRKRGGRGCPVLRRERERKTHRHALRNVMQRDRHHEK